MRKQFPLGQTVITAAVASLMKREVAFAFFVHQCLTRYMSCDWGDMDAEDKQQNEDALITKESRIFAAYLHPLFPEWKIWIITEYDYSVTTVLFPSDY